MQANYAKLRIQRARQADACLCNVGHDLTSGLLLDLGCGQGYLRHYFLNKHVKVVGVDVDKALLKTARNMHNDPLILADATKLPFREGSFHTVILNDILEHIPYDRAKGLVSEIRKSLTSSGRVFISVANKYQIREPHTKIPFLTWFPQQTWNAILRHFEKQATFTYYPYTIRRLKELCTATCFSYQNYTWFYARNKIIGESIADPLVRKMTKLMRMLGLTVGASFLAEKVSVILFICQKEKRK